MSMQAINFALTLPVEESGPRLLLFIIAHHVNYRTGDMFVGQDELAAELRRDERTARRYLGYLEEAGFIVRQEQRTKSGQRTTDRIELVGYLDWQSIIENGGVIPDPKTRGKIVQKPADKFSGRGSATGQNTPSPADKNPSASGHLVSGIKGTTNNQSNHSANADAHNVIGRATFANKQAPTAFKLEPDDVSWPHWIAWLTDRDRRDLVAAAQEARRMTVVSKWPTDKSPLPQIDRSQAIEKRKAGDVA